MDRWRSGGPQGKGESGAELRGRERQRASRRGRRACQVGPTRQWRGASGPCGAMGRVQESSPERDVGQAGLSACARLWHWRAALG